MAALFSTFRCGPKYPASSTVDTDEMNRELASIAALFGESARAAMLLKLMNGRAMPAGELALAANITPQTASEHLAKLVAADLLTVQRTGRNRYYRIDRIEVADVIEALVAVGIGSHAPIQRRASPPPLGTIAHARTCYAHLAGWLGVQIAGNLRDQGHLVHTHRKTLALTEGGREWFQRIGMPLPKPNKKPDPKFARECLDWTERQPHVAGVLGVALYRRLAELKWIVPLEGTRAVRITLDGKRELWNLLRIPIA